MSLKALADKVLASNYSSNQSRTWQFEASSNRACNSNVGSNQFETLRDAVNDSPASPGPCHWWRLCLGDGRAVEVGHYPALALPEVLAKYPAVSAEPFEPVPRTPDKPLTPEETTALRYWCKDNGEPDVNGVIRLCQQDADAREFCLRRASIICGL